MPAAKLTSKGQITIPQSVRDDLGLHAGDRVDFVAEEGGTYRVVPLRKDVRALRGRFAGRVAAAVSIEAMEQAVRDEAVARSGAAGRLRGGGLRSGKGGKRP